MEKPILSIHNNNNNYNNNNNNNNTEATPRFSTDIPAFVAIKALAANWAVLTYS